MGITKEAIRKSKERNILSEEQTVKVERNTKLATAPKPSQAKSAVPSSGTEKPASQSKSSIKPTSGSEKKKKSVRFVTIDEEETEFDEVMKDVKAKAPKATKITKEKPSGRTRSSKKSKTSEFDEALKQGKFTIVPHVTLE